MSLFPQYAMRSFEDCEETIHVSVRMRRESVIMNCYLSAEGDTKLVSSCRRVSDE